jgi:hypothetical protein
MRVEFVPCLNSTYIGLTVKLTGRNRTALAKKRASAAILAGSSRVALGGRAPCPCISRLQARGEAGSGKLTPDERKRRSALDLEAGEGRHAMKIRKVSANNRKNEFLVVNRSGSEFSYPYSKVTPKPSTTDPIEELYVDKELGNEAFTFVLWSGKEGSIHIEQVLEYNEDPRYLADLLTYRLSVEAQKRLEDTELSRRQLAKRLKTSVPQLYRLLDPTNTNKSMNELVALLHILDCDVDLVVKGRAA